MKKIFLKILKEKKGCFVTFTKEEQLRGCIGHILPQKPLYECVIENSINAAVNDAKIFSFNLRRTKRNFNRCKCFKCSDSF